MIGDPVKGQAAWAFTQSTSGILIALLSPFLGAMADAGGRRKPYVFVFQLLLWRRLRRAVVGLSRPARSRGRRSLGGRAGDRRRGDVDRVQQRAAAQHRAARAHGLAERLRLGLGYVGGLIALSRDR